ncbi:hypothetical protein SAY87_007380 [Trapa incisa]|uniref:Uncharacterized protein n=1 Tax=Trapa incisa TaxID=236973 RepID=A0AAN7K498_9MYRT|nr:hypothetical protein SAY87_007380 [Trapa incisa]
MGRAPCCDKANVKKGPWAPDEDAKLKAYIEKYGTGGNWIALPHKVGRIVVNSEANWPDKDPPQASELSNSALERLQLHMQFQYLPNPLSYFYNNPALWSKIHPLLQENMVQSLRFMPQHAVDLYTPEHGSRSPALASCQRAFQQPISEKIGNLDPQVELGTYSDPMYDNSRSLAAVAISGISSCSVGPTPINYTSDIITSNIDQLSDTRYTAAELENMANSRIGGVMSKEELEFDYFKSSNGSDECFNRWSKDFHMRYPLNPLDGSAVQHKGIETSYEYNQP